LAPARTAKFQEPEATMASIIRKRVIKIKEGAKAKTKPSGWVLPKEASSFAEEGTWYVFLWLDSSREAH